MKPDVGEVLHKSRLCYTAESDRQSEVDIDHASGTKRRSSGAMTTASEAESWLFDIAFSAFNVVSDNASGALEFLDHLQLDVHMFSITKTSR